MCSVNDENSVDMALQIGIYYFIKLNIIKNEEFVILNTYEIGAEIK